MTTNLQEAIAVYPAGRYEVRGETKEVYPDVICDENGEPMEIVYFPKQVYDDIRVYDFTTEDDLCKQCLHSHGVAMSIDAFDWSIESYDYDQPF